MQDLINLIDQYKNTDKEVVDLAFCLINSDIDFYNGDVARLRLFNYDDNFRLSLSARGISYGDWSHSLYPKFNWKDFLKKEIKHYQIIDEKYRVIK